MADRKYCPFHQYSNVDDWFYCDRESCELWSEQTSYTFNVHEDGLISEDKTVTGGCSIRLGMENFVKAINWEGIK